MTGALTGLQLRVILASVLAMASVQLEFYGITIVLPSMGHDLDLSSSQLEWILNAELIAFAAPLIAAGRFADIFGRRFFAIVGSVVFGLSTMAIGFASDPTMIIFLRVLQGLAQSMICVSTLALVSRSMGQEHRALGIGIFTGGYMLFGAIGPLCAGLIVDFISWRWVFFVYGFVCAAAVLSLVAFIPSDKPAPRQKPLDIRGFAVLITALTLLILGLQLLGDPKIDDLWPTVSIVAGVLLFLVFLWIEPRAQDPLIDFALFSERNFIGACIFAFLSNFPVAVLLFILSMYLQYIVGVSATANGLIFLAMMIPLSVVPILAEPVMARFGSRLTLAFSMALSAFSFVCFAFLQPEAGLVLLMIGLALVGAGRGLMFPATGSIVLSAVPEDKSAAAAGTLQFVRGLAFPLGIAVTAPFFRSWENVQIGNMFQLAGNRLGDDVQKDIHGLLSGSESARQTLMALAPKVADRVDLIVDQAFAHGFRNVMFLSLALSVVGLLSVFIIRRGSSDIRLHDQHRHHTSQH
ncbi:MAG: MFS transporter [Pseudomonadota bacterium]